LHLAHEDLTAVKYYDRATFYACDEISNRELRSPLQSPTRNQTAGVEECQTWLRVEYARNNALLHCSWGYLNWTCGYDFAGGRVVAAEH
jgi:hypothetical protein